MIKEKIYRMLKQNGAMYETAIHKLLHTDESFHNMADTATALIMLARKKKIDLFIDKNGNRDYSNIRNLQ